MQTSHKLSRIFVALAALIVFSLSALAQGNPNIVFDGAPGTAAPPPTLGGYTMVPFPLDTVNPVNPFGPFTPNTTTVAVPAGSLCGGALGFAAATDHRRIPTSWASDWGAYGVTGAGDVYWGGPGNGITINLPAGTRA